MHRHTDNKSLQFEPVRTFGPVAVVRYAQSKQVSYVPAYYSRQPMRYPLRTVLGCDARSLALFRVAISCLLLFDVGDWILHTEQLFSPSGLLDSATAKQLSPFGVSLTYLSESIWYTKSLLLLLAMASISLGLGWHTKPATIICWVLLVSFHVRDPLVLISGDALLRMMLLWSIFTPVEQVWSLDARKKRNWSLRSRKERKEEPPVPDASASQTWVFTAGTVCLILQVCMMYWSAGLAKFNDTWFNGTALEYVLRSDVYARPLGGWLLNHPTILKGLTQATPWLEITAPLLLFLPFANNRMRLLAIVLLGSFHLGIEASLSVGKFSVISMIAWLPLLPATLWNISLPGTTKCPLPRPVQSAEFFTSGGLTGGKQHFFALQVLPTLLLLYVMAWNCATLVDLNRAKANRCLPRQFYQIAQATMLKQKFHMFYEPPRYNARFAFYGQLRDETIVELRTGNPLNSAQQQNQPDLPMDWIWIKVHRYLLSNGSNQTVYRGILNHYTQRWNLEQAAQNRVSSSRLACYRTPIGPAGPAVKATYIPVLAEWTSPSTIEISTQKMQADLDKTLDQLENGPFFPTESD